MRRINGHVLNGKKHNGHNKGHNGHALKGHNGHDHKPKPDDSILIDRQVVAILVALKDLREQGHSAGCCCQGCMEIRPKALKYGLLKAAYSDVYGTKPSDFLTDVQV